jgi:hypothetical protein
MTAGVLLLIGLCLLAAPGGAGANESGETVFDDEQAFDIPAAAGVAGSATNDVGITSTKETLIRSNPFVVTVTGGPNTEYYLYVRDAAVAAKKYPYIKTGQPSVTIADDAFAGAGGAYVPGTAAVLTTDAEGARYVEFGTTANTTPSTYVITALDPADASNFGDLRVTVRVGDVTITAEGAGTYYMGDRIKLSGTNTDSNDVYLFMTGPTLPDGAGVAPDNLSAWASAGNYVRRPVESDDTWEYRWDTTAPARSGQILDLATYTVYACSNCVDEQGNNVDKYHLSGVQYQTFSLVLKAPSITMQSSGAVAARGDPFTIAGYVNGESEQVKLWVFGENFHVFGANVTVNDIGYFAYTLDGKETQKLSSGRYDVVVQHPAVDGTFNVYPFMPENSTDFRIANTWSSDVVDLGGLAPSEAAAALVEMIEVPKSDDVCCRDSFSVDDAWLAIDPIENRTVGRWVEITGTTNIAADSTLNVEVFSNASVSCTSGQVRVIRNTGCNRWAFTVDSSGFEPGPYVVTIESAAFGIHQNGSFSLVEKNIMSEGVLSLSPGWNFVSTPKALAAGNDTAAIFAGVASAGHSALRYDAPARTWVIMKADDQISPLEGYWIYAAEKTDVHLTYASASPQATPERALITGWNAIGFSDTEPAAAREALFSLGDAWWKLTGFNTTTQAYEIPIIQDGGGEYSDARLMMPMKGYWLYMTENGTLAAMGV